MKVKMQKRSKKKYIIGSLEGPQGLGFKVHTPKLLIRFNCEFKCENSGRIRSWGTFLGS